MSTLFDKPLVGASPVKQGRGYVCCSQAEHGQEILMCSNCGFGISTGYTYEYEFELPPSRFKFDKPVLTAAWAQWDDDERELYLYWLEVVKPHEKRDLHGANFAYDRVRDFQELREKGHPDPWVGVIRRVREEFRRHGTEVTVRKVRVSS